MSEAGQDQDQDHTHDQDRNHNQDQDQDKEQEQDQDLDQDHRQDHEQDQGDFDAPVCDSCNIHAAVYWSDTSSMMLCDSDECTANHTDLARIADAEGLEDVIEEDITEDRAYEVTLAPTLTHQS
jgi:hypothetical protein